MGINFGVGFHPKTSSFIIIIILAKPFNLNPSNILISKSNDNTIRWGKNKLRK